MSEVYPTCENPQYMKLQVKAVSLPPHFSGIKVKKETIHPCSTFEDGQHRSNLAGKGWSATEEISRIQKCANENAQVYYSRWFHRYTGNCSLENIHVYNSKRTPPCLGAWVYRTLASPVHRVTCPIEYGELREKARDDLSRVPPSRGLMDGAPRRLHPAVTRRRKMIMQEAWQKRGIRVEGTNSLRAGWVKWPWSKVRLSRGIAQTHLVSTMWRRLKGGCDISRTSMGCGLIPSDEVTISSSSENI